MDDICDIFSDIPAHDISNLFGIGSNYVQKKLAMR